MRGHIRRRGKRSWGVVLEAGRDPSTGRRKQKWTSIKGTKRDAQQRLTELLRSRDKGIYIEPSKITVRDYLNRWLVDYAEPNVAPTTLRRYRAIVRTHLIPVLGSIRLADLKPKHIVSAHHHWRTHGRADGTGGLAPYSVLYNHRILHQALGRH